MAIACHFYKFTFFFCVVFSNIPDHQILNFYIFKLILDFIYLQGKVLYKTFQKQTITYILLKIKMLNFSAKT